MRGRVTIVVRREAVALLACRGFVLVEERGGEVVLEKSYEVVDIGLLTIDGIHDPGKNPKRSCDG